jgi:protein PhnA
LAVAIGGTALSCGTGIAGDHHRKTAPMEYPICPKCKGENAYPMDELFVCPDCGHEWNPAEEAEESPDDTLVVKDANGVILQNGDSVIVIKNLPVKGASQGIKVGTKVRNIRLTDGDHNIDCKIEGFGAMGLKSEFVKKA